MSFHILYESTTADATDVNDNFYHIAQGSRLPMEGVAMEYTDNALDLGSSSVRWNNLICANIDTASVSSSYAKMPIVLCDYVIPADTNEFEVTGLNGDNSIMYKIILFLKGHASTTQSLYVCANTFVSSSYPYIELNASATTIQGAGDGGAGAPDYFPKQDAPTGGNSIMEYDFYCKTGNPRVGTYRFTSVRSDGEYINGIFCGVFSWMDTTVTITSLKFFCATAAGNGVFAGTRVILMGMDNQ